METGRYEFRVLNAYLRRGQRAFFDFRATIVFSNLPVFNSVPESEFEPSGVTLCFPLMRDGRGR